MLSRFCKLSRRADVSVANLRRYAVLPQFSQDHDEKDDGQQSEKNERIPIIVCKQPQFNFYKGKTYSKFETIPLASQGWHHSKSAGDYFTINPIYNEEDDEVSEKPTDFEDFCLHPNLIENLREMNICIPTKIQKIGIPSILSGQNTVLSAETGCGKTFAFLLPTLNDILKWKRLSINDLRRPNSPFGLIITPSRELADQIGHEAKKLSSGLNIGVKVLTGGRTKRIMSNPSMQMVDLLVGTFGVISKLITNKVYKLDYIRHVILDEAHALFHETFEDKLQVLLRRMSFERGQSADASGFPTGNQLTLVSATKPQELPEYLNNVLDINSLVNVATANCHRVMVPQKFMRLHALDKASTLLKLVKPKAMKKQPVIVFSNDSTTSDWINIFFNEFNVRAINVNGEMPMAIRKGRFASFQKGEFNVLSTTNAGSRGLDTVDVKNVINYDLPLETADYIHRCGRTGRIGSKGECRVTNFIARSLEVELTQKIERATRRNRPLPIFNMLEEHEIRKEKSEVQGKKTTVKRRQNTVKVQRKRKKIEKPM